MNTAFCVILWFMYKITMLDVSYIFNILNFLLASLYTGISVSPNSGKVTCWISTSTGIFRYHQPDCSTLPTQQVNVTNSAKCFQLSLSTVLSSSWILLALVYVLCINWNKVSISSPKLIWLGTTGSELHACMYIYLCVFPWLNSFIELRTWAIT